MAPKNKSDNFDNARHTLPPISTGTLKLAERQKVFLVIVQQTQNWYFSDLLKMLKTNSIVTVPSLAKLTPFIDNDNVIRFESRLLFPSISHGYQAKYPILLPKTSHLMELQVWITEVLSS